MGCGASADTKASVENMKEMCDVAAKDMEILCVTHAMSGISDASLILEVRTPDCVNSWKETVQALRDQAAAIEKAGDEGGGDKAEKVAGAVATGGMLGNALGSLAKVADNVTDKVMEVGATALSESVRKVASTLEASIQKLEEPFQQVGKDVVTQKYSALLGAFSNFINNYKFSNSLALIRGPEPYGQEQYQNVDKDGITQGLLKASLKEMVVAMLPTVTEEVANHLTTKSWKSMLECNQSCCGVIKSLISKSDRLSPLNAYVEKLEATTDLDMHITGEICTGLLKLMSAREDAIRNASDTITSTHSKQNKSFQVVFSGTIIMQSHYQAFKSG